MLYYLIIKWIITELLTEYEMHHTHTTDRCNNLMEFADADFAGLFKLTAVEYLWNAAEQWIYLLLFIRVF